MTIPVSSYALAFGCLAAAATIVFFLYKNDDHTYTQKKSKRRKKNEEEEEWNEILLKVPLDAVGFVIGKDGENIKEVKNTTGAIITFLDEETGETSRSCKIRGHPQSVRHAETLILKAIQERGKKDRLSMKTSMVVPKTAVGRIIGKEGCNIQASRFQTGAKLSVNKDFDKNNVLLELEGHPDQISHACKIIEDRIDEDKVFQQKMPKNIKNRPARARKVDESVIMDEELMLKRDQSEGRDTAYAGVPVKEGKGGTKEEKSPLKNAEEELKMVQEQSYATCKSVMEVKDGVTAESLKKENEVIEKVSEAERGEGSCNMEIKERVLQDESTNTEKIEEIVLLQESKSVDKSGREAEGRPIRAPLEETYKTEEKDSSIKRSEESHHGLIEEVMLQEGSTGVEKSERQTGDEFTREVLKEAYEIEDKEYILKRSDKSHHEVTEEIVAQEGFEKATRQTEDGLTQEPLEEKCEEEKSVMGREECFNASVEASGHNEKRKDIEISTTEREECIQESLEKRNDVKEQESVIRRGNVNCDISIKKTMTQKQSREVEVENSRKGNKDSTGTDDCDSKQYVNPEWCLGQLNRTPLEVNGNSAEGQTIDTDLNEASEAIAKMLNVTPHKEDVHTSCNSHKISVETIELPMEERNIKVYISAMDNISEIWVQIANRKTLMELDKLTEEMTAFYKNPQNMDAHKFEACVGDFVASRFPNDENWYRAKVLHLKGKMLSLLYVDYGDVVDIHRKQVLRLHQKFCRLKLQAIKCLLANVRPPNEKWTMKACDYFERIAAVGLQKTMLTLTVKGHMEENGSLLPCVELTTQHNLNLAKDLVSRRLAVWDSDIAKSSSASSN